MISFVSYKDALSLNIIFQCSIGPLHNSNIFHFKRDATGGPFLASLDTSAKHLSTCRYVWVFENEV